MVSKDQMNEYLQTHFLGCGFENLQESVINKGNCVFCGLCASLCPRIDIKDEKPLLIDSDAECSTCFKYCSRTYFPKEVFAQDIIENETQENFNIGNYKKVTVAKTTNEKILNSAQNGGVVSTLLIQALKTGLIDGALLTGRDENWQPKPIIATTPEEILNCAGSKYTVAPSLINFNEAVHERKIEKLAFVGVPCQIQSARKLKLWNPLSEKYGNLTLIIGLYCYSNFSYPLMEKYIQGELGIPLNKIKKMDIHRGKLVLSTVDNEEKKLTMKDIKPFYWNSCNFCKDYTAEFADISVGSVGAPENKWNSVIIRSDIGMELFENSITAGEIIEENTIDLPKIEKEALRKKIQISRANDELISAIKLLNISDHETLIYTTLVSLGYSNLEMLNMVAEIPEESIKSALDLLIQRKWVIKEENLYVAENPIEVFSNEIAALKKTFDVKVNTIQKYASNELQTLFLQNNSMREINTEFKELID